VVGGGDALDVAYVLCLLRFCKKRTDGDRFQSPRQHAWIRLERDGPPPVNHTHCAVHTNVNL